MGFVADAVRAVLSAQTAAECNRRLQPGRLAERGTPAARTHDIVLGVTLKSNGVKCFFTRNIKDFHAIGFRELVNPIDGHHPKKDNR